MSGCTCGPPRAAGEGSADAGRPGRDQVLPPAAAARGWCRDPRLDQRPGDPADPADPGLGAGGLREDDAARRLAGRQAADSEVGTRRIAWVSLDEADTGAAVVLVLRADRPRARRTGHRRRGPGPAGGRSAGRDRPGDGPQRAQRPARRRGPRARRLPPRREPGDPAGRGVPARAPAAAGAPGHQHPRRPGAAAGPAAGAWGADRGPRGRPPVHPRGGGRLPRRRDRARAGRARRRGPGGPDRGLDRVPAARRDLAARTGTTRRGSSRGSPATTGTSWTTSSRRSSTASPRTSATSCSAPPSSSGSPAPCATPSPRRPASGQMLESLERRNLFVVPLDDQRRWYRYHHLFADVLRRAPARRAPRPGRRAAPARQRVVPGRRRAPATPSGTPSPPATSPAPPTWSSSPSRRCAWCAARP